MEKRIEIWKDISSMNKFTSAKCSKWLESGNLTDENVAWNLKQYLKSSK